MATVRYQEGTLVDQCHLMALDNHITLVGVDLNGTRLNIEIIFHNIDNPDNSNNALAWSNQPNGNVRFNFYNWNAPLGQTTSGYATIGRLPSGSDILICAHNIKVVEFNRCTIQFILSDARA